MNALEELELKVGLLCRCLTCCCPPGQGHKHPDWIDAWGEGGDVENEEVTEVESAPVELAGMTEREEWRRETAMRLVIALVEKQPDLIGKHDVTGSYRPANHLVVAARLVEMAAAIEPYLSGRVDDTDETA